MEQKQTETVKSAQPKEVATPSIVQVIERQEPVKEKAPQPTSEGAERGMPTTQPAAQQQPAQPTVPEVVSAPALVKSQRLREVESILSDGLQDLYWSLTPPEQKVFREKGEEVARSIDRLLDEVSLRIAKVIAFIKGWLQSIPHVNRFFLEQEAKIKADDIRALYESSRKKL